MQNYKKNFYVRSLLGREEGSALMLRKPESLEQIVNKILDNANS